MIAVKQPGFFTCLLCISVLFLALRYFVVSVHACVLSCVRFSVTPWTIGLQAPLSLEFFRQEFWSGLAFPPPGDLSSILLTQVSNLRLLHCLHWQAGSLSLCLLRSPNCFLLNFFKRPKRKKKKLNYIYTDSINGYEHFKKSFRSSKKMICLYFSYPYFHINFKKKYIY